MKAWKLAALAAVAWTPNAGAVLMLSASVDGAAPIIAIDNSLVSTCPVVVIGGCQLADIDPAIGTLTLGSLTAGAGGDLLIGISTQTQTTASGPGFINRLDSTGTQLTNTGDVVHTVSLAVGATDFAGPTSEASVSGAVQWSTLSTGAIPPSSIIMRWYNDPTNQQGGVLPGAFQPGILLATALDVAGPTNPDSFAVNLGPFLINDPLLFGMTLQFDARLEPGVRVTGREMTEVKPFSTVPEPLTLALFGVGLIGLGLVRMKR